MTTHHPVDELSDDMPFADATRVMVWNRFETMWRYRDGTMAGDVDALHDMRVGSRRLRAALDMAALVFNSKEYRTFGRLTEQLTEHLGAVRDGDVLLGTLDSLGAESGADGRAATEVMRRLVGASRDMDRVHLLAFFDELAAAGYARLAKRLWHNG